MTLVSMCLWAHFCFFGLVLGVIDTGEPRITSIPQDSAAQEQSVVRALLVGCDHYHYLKQWQLEGPANDVDLMRRILTSTKFKLSHDNIRTLAGWPDQESLRPTRVNIVREFERLIQLAGPSQQVVILLAGHGSQQPADDDPNDLEPDGLDETFLAADAKGWDGKVGRVENSITDDEIRDWLTAIQAKGASVWFLADSCHSGTLTRGGRERMRQVPASELVPKAVLAAAGATKQRPGTHGFESSVLDLGEGLANLAAIYAAHPDEVTPEDYFPENGKIVHGLFSYTLGRVLMERASTLTYRELAEEVERRYRTMRLSYPAPLVEGGAIDRAVLGIREWPERPRIRVLGLEAGGSRFRVGAGQLHGLATGSVLAVFPADGIEDFSHPVAHLRIVQLGPLESLGEPVAWAGMGVPEAADLPLGSRCQIVFQDFGDMQLRVALQRQRSARQNEPSEASIPTYAPRSGPSILENALGAIEMEPGGLVRRVVIESEADWLVRMVNDQVLLIPASGWLRGDLPSPFILKTGTSDHQQMKAELQSALRRIARARNLLRLAGESKPQSGNPTDVQVHLEILRDVNCQQIPVKFEASGRQVHLGEKLIIRATNVGRVPIDVTLLFVDSGYGIKAMFPINREFNRLQPNQSHSSTGEVSGNTMGNESIVAIATRGTGTAQSDFSYLAQPTIEQSATRGDNRTRSPLTRLVESFLYGQVNQRGIGGLRTEDTQEYAIELIGWTVTPGTPK